MGTSKKYDAPTGGNWPSVKTLVAAYGENPGDPGPEPPNLDDANDLASPSLEIATANGLAPRLSSFNVLSQFIAAHSGAARTGRGTDGGGRRTRSSIVGQQGRRTATNLGRFASRVGQVGLAEALREIDLGDYVGRPAAEVLHALVDSLSGQGSTMDEVLSLRALNEMRAEILANAQTFEDVESKLSEVVASAGVDGLLMDYYSHYVYAKFERDFWESLQKKHGSQKARATLDSVRQTILRAVRTRIRARQPQAGDWNSRAGARMADAVLSEVLTIFEVNS